MVAGESVLVVGCTSVGLGMQGPGTGPADTATLSAVNMSDGAALWSTSARALNLSSIEAVRTLGHAGHIKRLHDVINTLSNLDAFHEKIKNKIYLDAFHKKKKKKWRCHQAKAPC